MVLVPTDGGHPITIATESPCLPIFSRISKPAASRRASSRVSGGMAEG